ncbi:hypothetical protein KR009_011563, partial [Drosophila setifemur]
LFFHLAASILLIGFADLAAGSNCGCTPCGPGGVACKGCPEKQKLCQELISQVRNLQVRIRQCVCGEPSWML